MIIAKTLPVLSVPVMSLGFMTECKAAFIMNAIQTAQGVLVTGSGTVNTSALTAYPPGPSYSEVYASKPFFIAGPITPVNSVDWGGIVGPSNLGSGGELAAASGSGQVAGIRDQGIIVPFSYASGSQLTDSCLFYQESFSYLGLTQGQYVYTWGSGSTADSLTINIGTPVPEPASVAVVALPATLALLRRRRARVIRSIE